LGTTCDWERKPENKDELECVVKGEPVHRADGTLEDGQERKDHPIREPLCIIGLARAEQSLQRIITRDHEAGEVHEQLAADVEEDKEEIRGYQPKDSIALWDRGLFLQVVQERILGELLIKVGNMPLGFVLEGRHGEQRVVGGKVEIGRCVGF